MEEREYVTLEDGNDYIVIDEIDGYVYLAREDDVTEFCIRKVEEDMGCEFFVGLKDEEELNVAMKKFMSQHKNDLDSI